MTSEMLTAVTLFVVLSGRVLGGVQWHLWHRRLEGRNARRTSDQ